MHRLLKPKNIHRLALALVLLAPLAYLFGTQIATLAGAHGEELLAETTVVTPSYDELMAPENFSYGAFDWDNEHGKRLGFSLGYLQVDECGYNYNFALSISDYGVGFNLYYHSLGSDHVYDYGLGFSGDNIRLQLDFYADASNIYLDNDYDGSRGTYSCFYTVSDSTFYDPCVVILLSPVTGPTEIDIYTFGGSSTWESVDLSTFDFSGFYDEGSLLFYFDDGSHLPEGVTWNDELRSYFVPTVKPVETTSYRNALFGNMFGSSNFLTRWGENALSENPVGFAPFGSLFRFVDSNMLHLSNEQIGLMGYGYMYYAVHVLLFDVLVLVLAFVATLPQRILNMVNDRGGIE